jgi:hypothetical protein
VWRAPTAPSHSRCRHPARPVAHHIAHARRRAPSLPHSSWLTALTRRALPCATASFSLLGASMGRVEFAEKGTAATPNIEFALFLVVFWPFPHPSYPGVRGAGCNLASWSIQTPGFALPQPPAPARSSQSDSGQNQDLAPTDPPHPTYSYLLLPLVGTLGRRGWRSGCAQPPLQVRLRPPCALESAGRPCGRAGVAGRPRPQCIFGCEQRAQAAQSVASALN